MQYFVVEQHHHAIEKGSHLVKVIFIGGTATVYSKRANRGHNPKYEQDAYVSFCGQKRKQPEGGLQARLGVLEKETFESYPGDTSALHDGKEEIVIEN
jgi:hypothetical protein